MSDLFKGKPISAYIYRTVGNKAPIWGNRYVKILVKAFGYLGLVFWWLIVIYFGSIFLEAFLTAGSNPDNNGESCFPYGDCY